MSEPTQAIVFDAVGTLIRPAESISAVYQRIGAEHGIDLNRSIVKARFGHARRMLFSNELDQPSSELLERGRWNEIVRRVFEELDDTTSLFESLWNHYARPDSWIVFPEVPECVARLFENRVSVAIASNFDNRLFGICRATRPLDRISNIFCSGQLGFCKPDPRFYIAVMDRLGNGTTTKPPLMIGDDLEKDVLAARSCGWEALHLDRPHIDLYQLLKSHLGDSAF